MLEAAVRGVERGSGSAPAGVLGVSVLTSIDIHDLERLGIQRSPGQLVGKMARVASEAGCEGLVCSPLELNVVRQTAPDLVRVTPGIRPTTGEDDQVRTATPQVAIEKGADLLVIGRPITEAEDPGLAAATLLASILDDPTP